MIAHEVIKRGIVDEIFRRATLRGCSKKGDLKPHLLRYYWLTPPQEKEEEFDDAKVADVCTLYREAQTLN